MTQDLRDSIGYMRDVVARLRRYPFPPEEEEARDAVIGIIEEQIAEMERREGDAA